MWLKNISLEKHASDVNSLAIVLPTLNIGGVERVLLNLANGFSRRGWRVSLILLKAEGPFLKDIGPDVDIVNLNVQSYKRALFSLARYYNKCSPNFVITSVYATGLVATLARSFAFKKPRIIVGAQNSLLHKCLNPDNWKDRFFLLPLTRLILPLADGIVSSSKGVGLEIASHINVQSVSLATIYNPVDYLNVELLSLQEVSHAWLTDRHLQDYKVIVAVGRLVDQKGFPDLLNALSILRDDVDCRLIIIGEGYLRAEIEKISSTLGLTEVVDLVGAETNPYRYMRNSDLFVLPSRWEGLPTILIEALVCDVPIVATNCDYGPAEILLDGRLGRLVRVNDPYDLACKMKACLSSPDTAQARQARRKRAEGFSDGRVIDSYLSYFESLEGKG